MNTVYERSWVQFPQRPISFFLLVICFCFCGFKGGIIEGHILGKWDGGMVRERMEARRGEPGDGWVGLLAGLWY